MIKRLFEIRDNAEEQKVNRHLFKNCLIEKDKTIMDNYFGKYPISFFYLRPNLVIRSFDDAFSLIRTAVENAYDEHEYLALSNKLEASEKEMFDEWYHQNPVKFQGNVIVALQNLAKYLKKHWKKEVTVLVDEFDGICSSSFLFVKDVPQLTAGRRHCNATDEIEAIIDLFEAIVSSLLKDNANIGRGITLLTIYKSFFEAPQSQL